MAIGIIGAMECEIEYIRDRMEIEKTFEKASLKFFIGRYLCKNIILVKSGIGKVNAAICSQILIDDFQVDMIINVGVAGGIGEGVNLGDVVIATDLIQHDVDGTASNYELGQIPGMEVYSFQMDSKLFEIISQSMVKPENIKLHYGRIISGDQIIACTEKINMFKDKYKACAVEMESAAIGHVCYVNSVQFVIIRSISDKADEEMKSVYSEYERIALENANKVLCNMLNCL